MMETQGRKPRLAFFGTPEIAVPSLMAVHALGELVLVVAQPDRPKGRGQKVEAPPVKARAVELGVPVRQPTKLKDGVLAEELRSLDLDCAVVIAYGRILPKAILSAPRRGCVNVHASLLPRWRGAAPIQWAVASGDERTGISLMEMDEGLDTGPVFFREEIAIGAAETAGELAARIGPLGADCLRAALPRWLAGELPAVPQDGAHMTHARMLEKTDAILDFEKSAQAVHDWARGMNPWPGAETTLDGQRLKIHRTEVVESEGQHGAPGTVFTTQCPTSTGELGILVTCGHGSLALLEVQPEGKRRMKASEFVAGRPIPSGTVLGSPLGSHPRTP
jgi:methionyl-tRNA formyltransferase